MVCFHCGQTNRPGAHFCAYCGAPLLLQNKYRIVRMLGRGGFGTVYLAELTTLSDVFYAVKELTGEPSAPPAERQKAEQQFQLEALLLAKLAHPMLPKVWDYFSENNRLYLVMEYVEGETLEDRLDKNSAPLPEADVLKWMSALCEALQYLHTQTPPIVHRDIKPSNIKITPDSKIKLLDFGIAKLMVGRTGTLTPAISPPYSPWEQYGSGTDPRSDIYALGVTVYQLVTNHLPPAAPDRKGLALVPLRQFNSALSVTTENLVLKACADDPNLRFQTASEMRNAIHYPQTLIAPQPLGSVSPWISNPTKRTISIPTWLVAAITSALTALVLIFVAFAFFGRNNNIQVSQVPSPTSMPRTPTLTITTGTIPPTVVSTIEPPPSVPPTVAPINESSTSLPPTAVLPTEPPTLILPSVVPTTEPPTSVPPTIAPTPVPIVGMVEAYDYANTNELVASYVMNPDWGVNEGELHLDSRNGIRGMTLLYNIRKPPPDDYIILDHCFVPTQDWNRASGLEVYVANDDHPISTAIQFGEGRRCAGESFPGEVWRVILPLAPNQKGWLRLSWSDFTFVDWAPRQNGRIDLDRIGYFAVGMKSSAQGHGNLFFGPVRLIQ